MYIYIPILIFVRPLYFVCSLVQQLLRYLEVSLLQINVNMHVCNSVCIIVCMIYFVHYIHDATIAIWITAATIVVLVRNYDLHLALAVKTSVVWPTTERFVKQQNITRHKKSTAATKTVTIIAIQ